MRRPRRARVFLAALLAAALALLVCAPELDDGEPLPPPVGAAGMEALEATPVTADDPSAADDAASVASDASGGTDDASARRAEESRPLALATPAPAPARLELRVLDARREPLGGALLIVARAPSRDPREHGTSRGAETAPGRPLALDRASLCWLPLDVSGAAELGIEVVARATSRPDGRFDVGSLPPGRLRAAIRAAGHAPWDRDDVLAVPGGAILLGDVALGQGRGVSGVVEGFEGPVEGALVTRVDDFGDPELGDLTPSLAALLARVDERGGFALGGLPPGPVELTVSAPGRVARRIALAGHDATIAVDLERGAELFGRVATDKADLDRIAVWAVPARAAAGLSGGHPLPAAARAGVLAAKPRGDGRFRIEALPAGEPVELRIATPTQPIGCESPWSPWVIALAGAPADARLLHRADATIALDLAMPRAAPRGPLEAWIAGALPRAARAEPEGSSWPLVVAGVRPQVHREHRRGEPAGALPIEGDGRLARVALSALGAGALEHEIELFAGLECRPGRLTLEELVVVEVRVVDAASGRAIEGASVLAVEDGAFRNARLGLARATSDARGLARVTTLGARDSRVLVRAPGRAPLFLRGPFAPPAPAGQDAADDPGARIVAREARLERGASAQVRVVDAGGGPLGGVEVEHVEGAWTPDEGLDVDLARLDDDARLSELSWTDADGACRFDGLAAGRHTFRVVRARRALDAEWSVVEVAPGRDALVPLASVGFARLEAVVVAGGRPLAHARVALLEAAVLPAAADRRWLERGEPLPHGLAARADAGGLATFENLVPGRYALVVEVAGQSLRPLFPLEVEPGRRTVRCDVAESGRELFGRVVDGDGAPVEGAALTVVEEPVLRALADVADGGGTGELAGRFPLEDRFPATTTRTGGWFRLLGVARSKPLAVFVDGGERGAAFFTLPADREGRGHELELPLAPAGALALRTAPAPSGTRVLALLEPLDLGGAAAPPRLALLRPGLTRVFGALAPGAWRLSTWPLSAAGVRGEGREPADVVVAAGELVEIEEDPR